MRLERSDVSGFGVGKKRYQTEREIIGRKTFLRKRGRKCVIEDCYDRPARFKLQVQPADGGEPIEVLTCKPHLPLYARRPQLYTVLTQEELPRVDTDVSGTIIGLRATWRRARIAAERTMLADALALVQAGDVLAAHRKMQAIADHYADTEDLPDSVVETIASTIDNAQRRADEAGMLSGPDLFTFIDDILAETEEY